MEKPDLSSDKRFSSLEEEVSYLRGEIARRDSAPVEKESGKFGHAGEVLRSYAEKKPSAVLAESYALKPTETEAIVLKLAPKETDAQIGELIPILYEKGIHNVLSVIEKSRNAALEDDFHRFLVQYLKEGLAPEQVKIKGNILSALRMTLYELILPDRSGGEEEKRQLKELVSSMEQFYAGLLSIVDEKEQTTVALEVAVSNENHEVVFYAAVPDGKKDLFEKHFLAIFPGAKLVEQRDDYNVFSDKAVIAASTASFSKNSAYPLKFYDQFDYDPLNVTLNAFSKIAHVGEGAALQIIFAPSGGVRYIDRYRKAIDEIGKGKPVSQALDIRESFAGEVSKEIGLGLKDLFFGGQKKKETERKPLGEKENLAIEAVKRKTLSPIVRADIKIVAAAGNEHRAGEILSGIESSFNQFEDTQGNSVRWEKVSSRHLPEFIRNFSFRMPSSVMLPMSLRELTTIFHFPTTNLKGTTDVKQSKSATAPAPAGMGQSGILLGLNRHRNVETSVYFDDVDRLRHFYVIGQTGTGKSNLLKNMIIQDIERGEGVCFIDPHGSDIEDVLGAVPKSRQDDVIYFDPSYTARPMGLNMLEYDVRYPEQKTFVTNELISIFNKLFDMKVAGGPLFEQYFRNSAMLVMEDPSSGNTLIEIGRVLADKEFRTKKLEACENPIVKQFWESAERAKGESDLANFVPYITSKFDSFLSNDFMRPVVAQEKSSFNFREIMDSRKILLVNLSKGRLGDINANLIGLVLVGKILMAALSRVDLLGKDFPPFYLYIDEFQNITTDSISTILSEARKYKLSLTIAHQYIKQLDEKIKDAVFGNVGSFASFRIGAEDAAFLEKQFAPVFSTKDIMNLDNYNAYLKLLCAGKTTPPFNLASLPSPKGNKDAADSLKQLSYLKFGKDRDQVEMSISNRYRLLG